jgi:hypothetical protein
MSAGCTGLSRSVSVELEECARAYGQDNLVDLSSSERGELLEDLRDGDSSFTYNTKDYRYWLFQVGDNEGLLCENRVGGVGRALCAPASWTLAREGGGQWRIVREPEGVICAIPRVH